MKNWCRTLGLVAVLSLANLATVEADPWPEYGTCYFFCDEDRYQVESTYEECCSSLYYCPGGSYTYGSYWKSYWQRGPQLCGI